MLTKSECLSSRVWLAALGVTFLVMSEFPSLRSYILFHCVYVPCDGEFSGAMAHLSRDYDQVALLLIQT